MLLALVYTVWPIIILFFSDYLKSLMELVKKIITIVSFTTIISTDSYNHYQVL